MGEDSGMRVGDAEREEALRALGDHLSAGRLDVDEYGLRSAAVTTARTRGDVAALFADLPAPRPAFLATPAPAPRQPRLPEVLRPSAAVWPLLLILALGALVLTRGLIAPLLVIGGFLYYVHRRR